MDNMKLALFNFSTFISVSTINSQLIPFLNDQGYSPSDKGWILGISALASIIFASVIGIKSDTSGKLKPSFIASTCLFVLTSCLSFLYSGAPWLMMGSIIIMFGIVKEVMSINETWVFQIEPERFGKFHCFSALGLVSGSLLAGYLHEYYGAWALCILCIIASTLSLFLSFMIKDTDSKQKGSITLKSIKQLFMNKQYALYLIILFLLMISGFADSFVVVDKLIDAGGSRVIVSFKFAIQSMMEIPLYLFSVKLLKKIKPQHLLIFASFMTGVKFTLYGLVSTPILILVVAALQIFTHPILVLCSKVLIQEVTGKELAKTAQIVGFAIYFGLSGFITPVLGAYLVEQFDFNITLYGFAALSLIPTLLSIYQLKRYKNKV